MDKKRLFNLGVSLSLSLVIGLVLLVGCSAEKPAATELTEPALSQEKELTQSQTESTAQPPSEAVLKTGIAVGDLAPDFELPLLSGETVRLSDLRGKPVLINFMATWCGPCLKEFPAVQQIHEEYGDRVQVLAISVGEPREDVDALFSSSPYTFPLAFDADDALYEDYQVDFIPQSFFIDSDGVIVDYLMGGSSYWSFKTSTDKLLK